MVFLFLLMDNLNGNLSSRQLETQEEQLLIMEMKSKFQKNS